MPSSARPPRQLPSAVAALALAALALALAPPAAARAGAPHAGARLGKGKFLVASRTLRDPTFSQTVILLVDYDRDAGAIGVVVNRPSEVALVDALPELRELRKRKDVIYLGGPVGLDRMLLLVRTRDQPPQSLRIFDRVFASGSLAALRRSMTHGDAVRAYAGYAGWGPGQLDREVDRGDWFVGSADSDAVFSDRPSRVWDDLIDRFSGDWASLR